MNEKIFIEKARKLVYEYTNDNRISIEDVYVVWSCKTLQNNKALLSTPIEDGMYYEITYNGDKNEIYFDAYKKVLNKEVDL